MATNPVTTTNAQWAIVQRDLADTTVNLEDSIQLALSAGLLKPGTAVITKYDGQLREFFSKMASEYQPCSNQLSSQNVLSDETIVSSNSHLNLIQWISLNVAWPEVLGIAKNFYRVKPGIVSDFITSSHMQDKQRSEGVLRFIFANLQKVRINDLCRNFKIPDAFKQQLHDAAGTKSQYSTPSIPTPVYQHPRKLEPVVQPPVQQSNTDYKLDPAYQDLSDDRKSFYEWILSQAGITGLDAQRYTLGDMTEKMLKELSRDNGNIELAMSALKLNAGVKKDIMTNPDLRYPQKTQKAFESADKTMNMHTLMCKLVTEQPCLAKIIAKHTKEYVQQNRR
ncbi:MAG: hypothetical protein HAW66_01865 [Shewanella sp.]|nr:hypothetical protein [Shewanella sp.]